MIDEQQYDLAVPSIGEDIQHVDLILSPSNDPTSKYGIDWTFMNQDPSLEKKKNKQQENETDYIGKGVISFTQIGLKFGEQVNDYIFGRINYLIGKSDEKPQMNLDEVEKMKLQKALSEIFN